MRLCFYLKNVLSEGVESQLSDERLNELIMHRQLPSARLFCLFVKKRQASKDTDRSLNLELQKKPEDLKREVLTALLPPRPSGVGDSKPISRTLPVWRPTAVVYKYTLRPSSRHFFTAVKLFAKSEDNVWRNLSIVTFCVCSCATLFLNKIDVEVELSLERIQWGLFIKVATDCESRCNRVEVIPAWK